ncbi:serum response factor b isoform X7 [Hippoglossus hippoglossus]|uniref:serum response factor b isoform X7 n=1 Tax=Hippoglossus hippoglossus TaxID=8267 RepID=UPI00148B35A7|nr:serum response factor b isoform X7 [Hippoglossus hippoglossus]
MLPSQVGSAPPGNGSASGRGTTGHGAGVVGSGVRPVLVRAGQALQGVGECAAGRQGERDAIGMLGANCPGGPRGVRPGNGTGVTSLQSAVQGSMVGLNAGVVLPHGARFDPDRESAPLCSGSDNDSDSAEDDDPVGSLGDSRRGVKRERGEMEAAVTGQEVGVAPGGYGMVPGGVAGAKPGKKTRGRVKIKMEFIDNKLRRYTTFSKRKTGIMKKAYELSTLTGTQVLLLVASETGHVYTFATRKLQPMITSETGKALIQTCLNSPDSPPRSDPSTDQRMSATGFEETDLTYQVSESESMGDTKTCFCFFLLPGFTEAGVHGGQPSRQHPVHSTHHLHHHAGEQRNFVSPHQLLGARLGQQQHQRQRHRPQGRWLHRGHAAARWLHLHAWHTSPPWHPHHSSEPAAAALPGPPGAAWSGPGPAATAGTAGCLPLPCCCLPHRSRRSPAASGYPGPPKHPVL